MPRKPDRENVDPFVAQSRPELVFAIIAPLGVELGELIDALIEELDHVNYRSTVIQLSGLLHQVKGLKTKLKNKPEQDRIKSHMAAGTELRSRTEIGGILARIAVAANRAAILALARDADLFYIEAAFLDEDAELAARKRHLTAAQAGWLAREAGAKRMIPFHFSPRYSERGDALPAPGAAFS